MSRCFPPHIEERCCRIQDKCGSPVSIRLYRERDYASLAEMYRTFEPKEWSQGLPPRSEEKREAWLRYVVEEGVNLIATIDNKVVGHAALFEMEKGKSCEYLIFVHQDYQDRGIGTALSQQMKELAKELGWRQVWLTVAAINLKAIHVYEKVGFSIVGPRDVECVMLLDLSNAEKAA